jgi:hypothetical protein
MQWFHQKQSKYRRQHRLINTKKIRNAKLPKPEPSASSTSNSEGLRQRSSPPAETVSTPEADDKPYGINKFQCYVARNQYPTS